ncbi:MAG: hypothetical protein ACJ746_10445 [Bryobacteraceae bacterium]
MEAQWSFGLRTLAVLVATAVSGFAQAQTGARGQVAALSNATYTQANVPSGANSQSRKTAYPGAVNYVEGQATLNGEPLGPNAVGSAVVGANQVVATTNGYVEVLLTPGAFLRIGHSSGARFISAGLTGVNVELTRGSAMVEAAEVVKGTNLHFELNEVPVQIEKKGLYAFDAAAGLARVLDGKADVQQGDRTVTLKKGDELSTLNGSDKKHDFNIKAEQAQPLYVWSKVRSEHEAQANQHAANLILAGGSWYGPGWYWDPFWASYAFMPGAGVLYSPFGWGYYSPAFYGFYGGGFYPRYGYFGRPGYYRGFDGGHVAGFRAMHSGAGFRAGGFHGGRR